MTAFTRKLEIDLGESRVEAELERNGSDLDLILEVGDDEPIRLDLTSEHDAAQFREFVGFLVDASRELAGWEDDRDPLRFATLARSEPEGPQ